MTAVSAALSHLLAPVLDAPVDPTAPEARDWLQTELAKSEYQSARPTWFDLFAAWVRDTIADLISSVRGDGPPGAGIAVVIGIIVVVLVIAFLLFGLPRLNRRSRVTGELFGENDDRNSDAMRLAAKQAAERGDFALAIAEMFRSIARALSERTVLTVSPGTTARDFASKAGIAFPEQASSFADAAISFDDVRYLGRDGTREQYDRIAALDIAVRATRPNLDDALASSPGGLVPPA